MSPREALVFERSLHLNAQEHGLTRGQMLEWLNKDSEWDDRFDYPDGKPVGLIDGKPPFIQVTRTTNVRRSE